MSDTITKIKVATIWIDGCSGCHMSFLDIDERILDLAPHIDMVYGPLVDLKEIPEGLDLVIVEGAVANEADLHHVLELRKKSKFMIALGDCAVSGNVPSMRNPIGQEACFERAYFENADTGQQIPTNGVPALLKNAIPVHQAVKVDLFIQGCPPPADAIFFVLSELVAGRVPDPTKVTRFGA
ncbi:MAG TPA: NADP oxidoreductase [Phycisphaerales bacterium]|nr:NADP oxidoreductase [Phycisphaerales bacterium]HCD34582.1 NADP oxidoreductase [Phycisphaerales bacterium]|tara:strand:- start:322 stop:867 length:546 start_codon:yes stop_codon:yes gene_type:complete